MIQVIRDNMAPLMFAGLIAFMLIGYPAAFSLAAVGLAFAYLGIAKCIAQWRLEPERIYAHGGPAPGFSQPLDPEVCRRVFLRRLPRHQRKHQRRVQLVVLGGELGHR